MVETADGHDGGRFRLGDAVALHGAGSVDDERDVDGRARLVGLGPATLQGDAQVVLLRRAGFHDRQREAGVEPDFVSDCLAAVLAGLRIG